MDTPDGFLSGVISCFSFSFIHALDRVRGVVLGAAR
jgi:hypothetical protein